MIVLSSLELVGPAFGSVEHRKGTTILRAGAGTDAFVPPNGDPAIDRLPGLRLRLGKAPWQVAVRVEPRWHARFDAGAIMLRTDRGAWAKLAFERSPQGRNLAVTVVTKDTSDDANGPAFDTPWLFLRACSGGSDCGFHVSTDGRRWDLIRLFALPGTVIAADIVAQSPTGGGCEVALSDFRFEASCPQDMRDGS